jgi:hypothetical protein
MIRLDKCACGGTVYVGTDGNGRSIESCDRCHAGRFSPRALPIHHPELAEFEKAAAAARAELESHRHEMPLCEDCGTNHVGHAKAVRCAECAQERRRRLGRETYAARRVMAEHFA